MCVPFSAYYPEGTLATHRVSRDMEPPWKLQLMGNTWEVFNSLGGGETDMNLHEQHYNHK